MKYRYTLLGLTLFVFFLFPPYQVEGKSVSWTSAPTPQLNYCCNRLGQTAPNGYIQNQDCTTINNSLPNGTINWVKGFKGGVVTVEYSTLIFDKVTNAQIADGATIPVGTQVQLKTIKHNSTDISWFGSGFSQDSPNGQWRDNAAAPDWQTQSYTSWALNAEWTQVFDTKTVLGPVCQAAEDVQNLESGSLNAIRSVHIPVVIDPPKSKTTHTSGSLVCGATAINTEGTLVQDCTVTGAGPLSVTVNIPSTYAKFYYRYYDNGQDVTSSYNGIPMVMGQSPAGCFGNQAAMRSASGWNGFWVNSGSLASSDYQLNIPAQSITFNLTAVSNNNPPTAPTLTGPSTGSINADYVFVATASDPDNDTLKYGMDWDNNDSVDEWLPVTAILPSGDAQNFSHRWINNGTYTFKVLAQDSKGSVSGWSTPLAITIIDHPPSECTFTILNTCANGTCQSEDFVTGYGSGYTSLTASAEYRVSVNGESGTYTSVCGGSNPSMSDGPVMFRSCQNSELYTLGGVNFSIFVRGDGHQGGVWARSSISGCADPSLSFTINDSTGPLDAPLGANLNLVWSARNVTSCTGDGVNWVSGDDIGTSGSINIAATASDDYIISCAGPGGNVFQSVQVNIQNTLKICENNCGSNIELQPSTTMVQGSTKNLVACFNTSATCSESAGDVTTSTTWGENTSSNVATLTNTNPKLLSATAQGTEGISATYSGQTKNSNITVTCTDSGACSRDPRSQELCADDTFNITDSCGNPQTCNGSKSCDFNWKEVIPK